jgi:hypothetical protein
VGCLAHIINLAVQDILRKMKAERTTINEVDLAEEDLEEVRNEIGTNLVDEEGEARINIVNKVSAIY